MTTKNSKKSTNDTNTQTVYYDVIVWETRENSQGKKHIPHKVGFASQLDNGNLACKITDGIALTGRFTISQKDNGK